MRIIACLVFVGAASLHAATDDEVISQERMRQHIEYLASDDLAGRAPGTAGERMAVAYLARTLKEMGCDPGNPNGSLRGIAGVGNAARFLESSPERHA